MAVAVVGIAALLLGFMFLANKDRGGTLTMTQTSSGFTIVDRPS